MLVRARAAAVRGRACPCGARGERETFPDNIAPRFRDAKGTRESKQEAAKGYRISNQKHANEARANTKEMSHVWTTVSLIRFGLHRACLSYNS